MLDRWLTIEEAAIELRTTPSAIKRMVRKGWLAAVKVPHGVNATYRILDPSPKLREHLIEPPLERFPCITAADLADILGLSQGVLRWHVFEGHLKPYKDKNRSLSLFTPKDVRKFLARYEGRRGVGKQSYSAIIVAWMRRYLDELKPNAAILDDLLKVAVILPEPRRSELIVKLWKAFDEVNELLKQCRE